jgi:hypothetical protein
MKENGGFPPIKYCAELKKSGQKERYFAIAPKQNVSIRDILTQNKVKPLIQETTPDSDVEIVDKV